MLNKIKEKKMYDKMEQELWIEIREQIQKENNGRMTLNDMDRAREMAKEAVEKIKEENKKDVNIKDVAKKMANLYAKASKAEGVLEIGVGTARAIAAVVISAQMGAGVVIAAEVAAKHGLKLMAKGMCKGVVGKTIENLVDRD
jgi:hypothetical protein